MPKALARHRRLISVAGAALVAVISGFYVNLVTNSIGSPPGSLGDALAEVGLWNLLVLAIIGLLILEYRLARAGVEEFGHKLDRIIDSLLSTATDSLTRQIQSTGHVRAFIKQREKKLLRVVHSYRAEGDHERLILTPIDFGVVGRAIKEKRVAWEKLPQNHLDTYIPEMRDKISPELRAVIAAPIFHGSRRDIEPWGVLAVDSTDAADAKKFSEREVRELVQQWADILGDVIEAAES